MAQFFAIHPDNPQERLIKQVVESIQKGGVVVLPTDACYALVGRLDDKAAMERMVRVCGLNLRSDYLTVLCSDWGELGRYAVMDNHQFRLLKTLFPNGYACVLEASKLVPNRVVHEKRKAVAFRISSHAIVQAVLEQLGEPLLACSLILPEDEGVPLTDVYEIRDRLEHSVDLVVDGGWCGMEAVTVLDLLDEVQILYRGVGDVSALGLA